MKIILLKNIKKLGEKDSIINVSDGYAMNHLIPSGMAVEALAGRVKEMENKKKKSEQDKNTNQGAFKEFLSKVPKEITVQAKANEEGVLFAALSKQKIKEQLKEMDIEVEDSWINIRQDIKHIGEHTVLLKHLNEEMGIKILVNNTK